MRRPLRPEHGAGVGITSYCCGPWQIPPRSSLHARSAQGASGFALPAERGSARMQFVVLPPFGSVAFQLV